MNILQSLANDAKKKKDELVNAITGTGQQAGTPAPQQQLPMRSPVPQPSLFHQATNFLNTPTSSPLLRGLQTADKFVSAPLMPVVKQAAQGYDLARAGAGLVTGNQQATHNAMQATKNDYNATVNLAKQAGQQFLSRPAAELLTSLQPRQQTYTPGSRVEKAIFGDTPVQNIQKKVINNYNTHSNLPTWQRYGLAGAELAGSVAQDAPLVGGALKGAKIAKPVIADTAKAITAPKTFAGLPAKQVIMDTSKLDTLKNFLDHPLNSPNVAQSQDIIKGLHQIKNDHGLDFISGSHADRLQRVSQFLEQNGEAIPQYQASQAFRNKLMVRDQTGGGAVGDSPIINKLKGTRPAAELQTKLENAHNSGNTVLEAKLARQLPDQAMNPNATLPAARRAELMAKMQQASTADPATPVSISPDAVGATTKAGEPVNGTALAKNKTGIVDKQLNDLQTVHKQLLDAELQNVKNNPLHNPVVNPVSKYVRDHGGISSSAYEDVPKGIITKNGALSADKMAQELGYNSEDELVNALQTEAHNKSVRLTPTQMKDLALENLQTGKSEHSGDYATLQQMIKQRQDELSRYPTGARKQVKVTNKPSSLSDAELQSLSQTPEGQLPKQTNRVLERNDKKVLRNPDAERQVQDVLKKGGTNDEALSAYMKATGTDLQTAVKDVRRVAEESNLGFNKGKNPLLGTVKLPEVQPGDHGQAFLNADFVKQHEQAVGQSALDAFNGLSEHDKTLLQSIETDTVANVAKKAENPQAFNNAEKAIRTYYDTRHAYDHALGIDVGYRANYLRQLFAKAEDQAKAALPDQMNIKAGNKAPGYTQQRSFDTLNTHVGTALERDINGSSTNHAKLAYSEGLHQAYPGKVNSSGQLVRDDSGNYLQLTNKYGQGVTANKNIANEINSRSRTETLNKGLQAYDKVNAGVKYVKLGGGAFHALTEAGNFVGQQLSSGKFFTNPTASGRVIKTFFSPKAMDKAMGDFRANGTLDKAALSGLKIIAKDILADANVKLGGKISKYTGIQALHDATFQREIPYAKLKMFEQKTQGLDVNNPADLAKMRSVSQGINDLFGGINRDINGIKPDAFKRLQRFVLATDFTESKVRTAFKSINITDKSPAAQIARQAVIGKVVLFAGLASAGGALGGEYKGMDSKQVATDILKKLADPSFKFGSYNVGLPATHVSEFSRPLTPLFRTDGKDRFSGLQKYGTNRLAAVPSELLQLKTNKDATGARIYGKDYKANGGGQISGGKTAVNVASGLSPIPAAQGVSVAQGKTSAAAALANIAGLRANNYAAQDAQKTDKSTPVAKLKAQEKQQSTDLKNSLSAEDQKLSTLSKAERQKLIDSGAYTQAKFDGLDNYVNNKKQQLGIAVPADKTNNNISKDSQTILDEYNKLSADQRTKKEHSQSDYEYKVAQAKYENDKANGKLSKAEDINAQNSLQKAAIGSKYSKDVRELYGVNKADLYTFLTTDPNGQKYADQLKSYDQALKDNGIIKTGKYKNGFNTASGKGSRGGSGGRKKSLSTLIAEFKLPGNADFKNRSKAASLARNAKLAKKRA